MAYIMHGAPPLALGSERLDALLWPAWRRTMKLNSALSAAVVTALLLLLPAPASAEPTTEAATIPGWPLKVGTSIWTRYEVRENYDRLGVSRGRFQEGDFAVYRARLTLQTAPIDLGGGQAVTLHFSPQADGFWGNQPSTISNPNFGVYEAFVRLNNDLLTLDVGHFAMNYGDALIIGDLRWHQTARSFDGARIRLRPSSKPVWVDVFFTQQNDGLGGPDGAAFAGDVFFAGVYASLGGLIGEKTTIEPYLLTQIWVGQETNGVVTSRPATQATLGVRAVQKYGLVDLRFEGGLQFGKRQLGNGSLNPDVLAFQVDAEVGFTLAKGFRLSIEGLFASGDDPTTTDKVESYDEIFPTTHKFLGLADVIGIRSNVGSAVLHVKYSGLASWVFKLDQHIFFRPETVDNQEGFAGAETDVNVIYKIGRGMTVRGLYAFFVPGSDHFFVEGTAGDDVVHYGELQYTFAY